MTTGIVADKFFKNTAYHVINFGDDDIMSDKKTHTSYFSVYKAIITSLIIFFVAFTAYSLPVPNRPADDITIDFDSRLEFYLDIKTKRFLKSMSHRESVLADMIKNINNELRKRKENFLSENDIGFNLIYGESDRLIEDYNNEIKAIKEIILEIDRLAFIVQRKDDLKLLNEVEQIKEQLEQALDEFKLKRSEMSNQEVAEMIHDYSREMKRLLDIYEDVDYFQKRASVVGDNQIVKQLTEQKERIIRIVEDSYIAGTTPDQVVDQYIEEAANVVEILRKLEQFKQQSVDDSTAQMDIDQIRQKLVTHIDERILNLFGYAKADTFQGVTISEYFKDWKAKKIAGYQAKYTKYRIIRDRLLKTGSSQQRDRMLEAEISDALLNYADGRFELAAKEFRHIFEGYSSYYDDLDGVIFYRSESNYANEYFDVASEGYSTIIQEHPNSKFYCQSLLRLAAINHIYNNDERFFFYYYKLEEVEKKKNLEREDLNKIRYLAAFRLAHKRHFDEASEILDTVPADSKYSMVARYLQALVFLNIDRFDQAKKYFEELTNKENYPWTDLNVAIIRNESLLKLGYFFYQRGEYDKAGSYFLQISKGYNYDKSLMGQAWIDLKKGNYNNAINKVDLICNNYLMSNYTYEAMVLSAHCKRIQDRTQDALNDLRYVADSKQVLNKVKEYNQERKRILNQLDELENLEERVLEQQNRELYPKVLRIRNLIENALTSFRYRGAVSSRMLSEYSSERKVILRQIEQFNNIIQFAEENENEQMLKDALEQRNRLVAVLRGYQLNQPVSNISYFLDYPLATKEGGIIYRKEIENKLARELLFEKQSIQKDLDIINELGVISDDKIGMDVVIDLEILEEDLRDLNNQLNRFQIWLSRNRVDDLNTETVKWANFSGFGISDINFTLYRQHDLQVVSLSKNVSKIQSILEKKKEELERRINRFDTELMKIQKEVEAEKIRLEKLEKEKYFQEIYFDTKTKEIEQEPIEGVDDFNSLFINESGTIE